ncbi:14609_t:CDS:2 [Gigaspora margarita]|uniref:14609_t:CDS:1 n=2 Tax=Gigaspora margarita TaxID=4874 RepID=A0ABN7UZQ1_GIGMA|nr:pwwp domain protein [Gigaspora margarita]CAG8706854.1 14609_t:CDS:2 [Gigaspora margarita]
MSYAPGNIVYAKLKGYPWWPARVEIESSLPSNVLSKKPKGPKPICGVKFFGTGDYGWFGNNDLKPFEKKEAEILLQKMQNKRRDDLLKKSIREALNPSSFDDPMEEDAVEEAATDDEEVELEDESKKSTESLENDDVEYEKKSKVRGKGIKKDKGHTASKAVERQTKASRSTKSKRKARDYSSGEEVVSRSGKGVKKRRATEDKLSKRKRSSVSLSYTDDEAEQMDVDEPRAEVDAKKKERRQSLKKDRGTSRSEGSKSPGKSDDGSPITGVENKQINDDAGFDRKVNKLESESQHRSTKSRQFKTPSEKLLHFRHKLQRMTIKSTKIELDDMGKIDEVFTDVENFPITIPLLKESKIGKLMRKIADLKIEPDPYNIKDRSDELIKKWKFLLEAPTQEGTDEDASPKMAAQVEGNSPQHKTVKHEEINLPLPEVDVKSEEQDRVENNGIKTESAPAAMELEKTEATSEDDKHVSDEVITNGSSPTANNQGVSIQEKEIVHNKSPEL